MPIMNRDGHGVNPSTSWDAAREKLARIEQSEESLRREAEDAAREAVAELRADWIHERPRDEDPFEPSESDNRWWAEHRPGVDLQAFLEGVIRGFEEDGCDTTVWFVRKVHALLQEARALDARTPEAFEDRKATMVEAVKR